MLAGAVGLTIASGPRGFNGEPPITRSPLPGPRVRLLLALGDSSGTDSASAEKASTETSKPESKISPVEPPSASTNTSTPTSTETAADVVEVFLTFDDGPHVQDWGRGKNHTERIINTLHDNAIQKGIRAVFFVQTHAPGRGGTQIGRDIIATVAKKGHIIGIHTGSRQDHASHRVRARARPYDTNGNGVLDPKDGANGLESDLIRAKARIRKLTGSDPLYVRPTYGERNSTVEAVYERQDLKMILWDIDSGDNIGSPGVDSVNENIHEGMKKCIAAGKTQLVILFHDINSQTAANLEEYIGNISISARNQGKSAVFPTSSERITAILSAKTYQ